jgi:hypothetical protein
MRILSIVLAAAALSACAPAKPVLYGNEKYQQVGTARAESDVAECEALANQAGATPGQGKAGRAAQNAGISAVSGAAGGAVGGAIWGSPGIGAAAGATSGVVWSLVASAIDWASPSQPSPAHVGYVNMCLAERGYQVAGWN